MRHVKLHTFLATFKNKFLLQSLPIEQYIEVYLTQYRCVLTTEESRALLYEYKPRGIPRAMKHKRPAGVDLVNIDKMLVKIQGMR